MTLKYEKGFKVNELFSFYTNGVNTHEDKELSNVFFVNKVVSDIYYLSKSGQFGAELTFPLYLYPETTDQQTFDQSTERTPNLNPEIIKEIEKGLGLTFVPEKEEGNVCFANNNDELRDEFKQTFAPNDLLDYIYAVLHSPSYREKYKEFLKIDFPRVPYPTDVDTFWKLVKLGGEIGWTRRVGHGLCPCSVRQDGGYKVPSSRLARSKSWHPANSV